MKVFVDTNVVLDFLLKREGFFEEARMVMVMGYNKLCDLYMSSLSFSNIAYIARKEFSGDALYGCFSDIRELLSVSSVTQEVVDGAIKLKAKDFEDAIQYFSARSIQADCIVTRNIKDFTFSEIPVYKPGEFLDLVRLGSHSELFGKRRKR